MLSLRLHLGFLLHDDLGPYRHSVVQIHHIRIHKPNTSRGDRTANRIWLVGAVDPVNCRPEVHRTRTERIAWTAGINRGRYGWRAIISAGGTQSGHSALRTMRCRPSH